MPIAIDTFSEKLMHENRRILARCRQIGRAVTMLCNAVALAPRVVHLFIELRHTHRRADFARQRVTNGKHTEDF